MTKTTQTIPTFCYNCVAGPDLLRVKVEDGVATEVSPDFESSDIHPGCGRVCVKAYGLIQKTYNPHRIKTPMKRTNPKKGRDQDPGFVPISWEEALDTIAGKLNAIQDVGPVDKSGYPRLAASFGGGGTPTSYMGTFPAFLSAWDGPIDFGFGSGQGVKCYHSEHLYGEFWHRGFTVCADTPLCEFNISFGANIEASAGVCGVKRHADARIRGMKRVQVEPHLSVTGACSAEWVPIKPRTDAAFLFAMLHCLLEEHPRDNLDIDFLRDFTSSPYLVAPNGFYCRHEESGKPLVWDQIRQQALPFDTPDIDPLLDGEVKVDQCIEKGADEKTWHHRDIPVDTAFRKLRLHLTASTPDWAAEICDVSAGTIRRLASEYLEHARVGESIEINGVNLPYRPVAITLGKTVNNGWGGYDCCWARTLMACLVGALEVPGGLLGTTVRLNRPATSRQASVRPMPDGFMDYPMNPTDRENWLRTPNTRNAHRTLVPLVANSPWSQALGPTHLPWMMQHRSAEQWPTTTLPDVWFVYRTNPANSFWDTEAVIDAISHFPFTVCFAYTLDETNYMADVLLPDCTDLESLQLIRIGGTKYFEQFWHKQGFALRQPVTESPVDARDFSWIATELADRVGVLPAYNRAINRGDAGVRLHGKNYDHSLEEDEKHSVEAIWDAACRSASAEQSDGVSNHGLDYFREKGFMVTDFSQVDWYLYPEIHRQGLRFEMPYQERLKRIGAQLANRLHESDIHWWDTQLDEYEPIPKWRNYPAIWDQALEANFPVKARDYPYWLMTARSMQYSWGNNADIQMIREAAGNIVGHNGVILNTGLARKLGIKDGELLEIASPLNSTRGHAVLRQGIRPDSLLMIGQFDHWATPLAKTFQVPSMNSLVPMLLDLTDSTGSGADLIKVKISKVETNQ